MNFVFYKNFQQPRSFPGLVFVDHSVSLSLYFHYDLKSSKYLSEAGFAENSKLTFLKRHIEARFCTSQQNSSYVNWSNTVQSKPKSLYSFASSNKRDECKICDQFSAFTLKLRLIANESAYQQRAIKVTVLLLKLHWKENLYFLHQQVSYILLSFNFLL